ncbi:signal peptide peptidase SppA [Methyloligella sp. 2.7D]|uniref:signal peptide peptidase SppA n=1 Tax=unclassified Methyloligella TaxID=2625955 RepID=UPI00157D9018|nr:signal peptide peptidase SppA [Methyloligella sp. GL2]QKP76065.1 signal peptide peptidase SppA [Methyloligella sp. GL2]
MAVLAIVGLFATNQEFAGRGSVLPHIARVKIDGMITEDPKRIELLDELRKSDQVKGVILSIDSPGGTTTGGEALYMAIRRLAKEKPVVASCGSLAASGAYIAAIATDHIVVFGNTLTGSVGVIFQWVNVTGLLDKVGVKVEEERSGPLKAVPNPFQPTSEQARDLTREMVDDAKRWFFGLVERRRDIEIDDVPGLSKGRIYSGRQAVKFKLADEIGDERTARRWLESQEGMSKNMRIVDWSVQEESPGIWGGLFRNMARSAGVPIDEFSALVSQATEPLQLDGLVSLWHATSR